MDRRRLTLTAVVLASAIVFLDSTIVNVALPRIGRELPVSFVGVLEGQSYVVNGYLLTLSALLILSGALADRYGRKRLFLIGLVGFGITSVLCGLAQSMEMLILFRLVQGAFGALLVPTSLAIINATFEGAELGRAFGIWAAASSATTVIGPLVGGFLVDTIGWRVAFLINAPLVAGAVLLALTQLPESRDEHASSRFDWLGAAVIAIAVGGLAYGAIRGQERNWADLSAWIGLGVGALATVLIVPLMRLRSDPLVPPGLFRSRNFTVTNISTFLVYGALYSFSAFMAIYLQGTLGYTAAASGATGLPIGILLAVFSTTVGTYAGRLGPRSFMAAGPFIMGAGLLWLARVPADSQPWRASLSDPGSLVPPVSVVIDLVPALLLFAVGITLLVAPLTTALMTSVPTRNSGLASAINNAISRIGPLLAGALIFIVVTASFYGSLAARVPALDTGSSALRARIQPLNPPRAGVPSSQVEAARQASTDAFHLAMLIAALLCISGGIVNAVGIRNPRLGAAEVGPASASTTAG
ncbi:MAG: MFS transporter [Chloroflexi bacterium]|nr:MAG: MFS transporter [Chloroflexota bacterium]